MKRAVPITLTLAVAALAWSPPVAAQKRGFQPRDYYRVVSVGEAAMSPTGEFVAMVVTTVVEEENKRHREIWLQPLSQGRPNGAPLRITDPTYEATDPVWSPDGRLLAFSSKRGDDPNPIWFLRVQGPGGEAFHIQGVHASPRWSPDGRWIAYVRAPNGEGDEEAERKGWIAPDALTRTLDPERFDGRVVTSLRYKRDGTLPLRPHFSVEEKRQIFVVSGDGGEPRQVTALRFHASDLAWDPEGERLFFTGDELEDDELRQDLTGDVWTVSRDGGPVLRLTDNPGSESAPAVSLDGRNLVFRSNPARGEQTDLLVAELGPEGVLRGQPFNLTRDWDLVPGDPVWTASGRVRFTAGIGGNRHLFEVDLTGGVVTQVTFGERRLSSFSSDQAGAVMAYTATDPVSPTELYVGTTDGRTEQRATGFNDTWLSEVELVRPERMSWTVSGNTEIEGWLMAPHGRQPGVTYPMVLKIHGGPHSAYGNHFFPTFHVLSAAGFYVLYPNPRGSSGYGHDFMYATRGRWGLLDKEDYLGAVDAALARHPDIDESRLGVAGGSYGGFMTNWLTATTDRFHAAVTSRSISNWESWYGTSDAQRLTEYEFFGPPWEQRDLYRRLSPISYVENVTAPTLIIHSENDHRTPIGDGEQWFMALKKRGVPVEFVRYPRSSHGLSRTGEPWLLVDRLERIRSWFDHWLGDGRDNVADEADASAETASPGFRSQARSPGSG